MSNVGNVHLEAINVVDLEVIYHCGNGIIDHFSISVLFIVNDGLLMDLVNPQILQCIIYIP